MTQSRQNEIRWGRWSPTRYVALCDDDKCPWKHVTTSYITVANQTDEHVAATSHAVTIHQESKLKVEVADA